MCNMHCRSHVNYLGLNCLTTIQENIYSHGISCYPSTKAGRTTPPPCHSGDARHTLLIKPPQRKYLHNATDVIACHPLSREHWCLDEDGSGCRLKERPSSIGISTTWARRSATNDITTGAIILASHGCQAVSGCATGDAPDVGLDLVDNWVTLWKAQGLSRVCRDFLISLRRPQRSMVTFR